MLAAAAFVVAFRVQAEAREGEPAPAALSPSQASALESDTARTPVKAAAPAVRLAQVADLPRLHREPRAKVIARRKAERAKARRAKAAARRAPAAPQSTPTPRPTATVAPSRPAVPAPAAPKPGGGYVGKDFDSEG